jgi:hypothetical protein
MDTPKAEKDAQRTTPCAASIEAIPFRASATSSGVKTSGRTTTPSRWKAAISSGGTV